MNVVHNKTQKKKIKDLHGFDVRWSRIQEAKIITTLKEMNLKVPVQKERVSEHDGMKFSLMDSRLSSSFHAIGAGNLRCYTV